MLPLVGIEPEPLLNLQHYPFWNNLACAADL